jgi:colanic acid biosynthesis glycosyl transferase WcaI
LLLKYLLLNQTFYPDVMATGQYLQEVALTLAERGHEVTVVTSRRAYDHPEQRFPKYETWRGIQIYRVASTGLGKTAKWRRAADFGTFLLSCSARLALLPRPDAIIALTSPPLISFIGASLAKWHRCRFFYWVMDFNPDQAVAAGWLRTDSFSGKWLERMSRFSLRNATKIIALDRFMRDRIVAKGVSTEKVTVAPLWSQDSDVQFDPEGRERFRKKHGLDGKFVVMYAGNHSPCHPLDTLLQAAQRLGRDRNIVFCFVGGGSEFRKIQQLSANPPQSQPAANLLCLPYQPLNELSAVLSAADLHAVVMGDAFVGLVHPCKIYNILKVAAPVLCVGPRPSHLTDILDSLKDHYLCASAAHGEVDRVVEEIHRIRQQIQDHERRVWFQLNSRHSKQTLLASLVSVVESA